MPVNAFQHVNIRTRDLERARDFYVRILGLRVGERPPLASVGYWLYLGTEPIVHLVQKGPDEPAGTTTTGALDHIAFKGADLEATRLALRIAGIPCRESVSSQGRCIQVFLHDPDGLKIELSFQPLVRATV